MKRLLLLTLLTVGVLFIFGYLNQGYREEKIEKEAAQEEQEMRDFEDKRKYTDLYTTDLKNDFGDNFKELYIFENELNINLFYYDLTEELAKTSAVKILEYLQKNNSKYDVEIRIATERRNDYGEKDEYNPFTLDVSNNTLYKFDFDFFDIDNLESTADQYHYYEY